MASPNSPTMVEYGRVRDAHAMEFADVLAELAVDPETGLDKNEVHIRTLHFGENWLPRRKSRSLLALLGDQLRGVIVWLLAAAAILSFAVHDYPEGIAIVCVLAVNTLIGFLTSWRAMRSMEALYRLADTQIRALRSGIWMSLPARSLVPGDIVALRSGDIVSADLRLTEAVDAHFDESTLTGESAPVAKSTEPVPDGTLVADRNCMAYKGTALVRGTCRAVVVGTGTHTELGRIAELAQSASGHAFPLEKRLDKLGSRLVWLAVVLSFLVGVVGYFGGRNTVEMIETAIALAVAAVPEGLPVVATLALARGMLRMARRNTLIARLSAVETLGSTTMILTDKTGTLTEGRMTATHILLPEGDLDLASHMPTLQITDNEVLRLVVETGVLCNSASLATADRPGSPEHTGSPLEIALLEVGRMAGISKQALSISFPQVRIYAFDAKHKAMATVHKAPQGFHFAIKGAPEKLLQNSASFHSATGPEQLSQTQRLDWQERIESSASRGFRLIGLAYKTVDDENADPFDQLVLLGFVSFLDPLRADVPKAIASCQQAGVRVVMMTGDHIATATEIANQAGLGSEGSINAFSEHDLMGFDPDNLPPDLAGVLPDADVFARVTPETKLNLVRFFQDSGHVVAMTGDGVNDAPALRQADIGIAMGIRGTQVAREAAEMVLKDDSFTSIVAAMRQGRIIYSNIRRFVTYLMSCNFSEILVVGIAITAGLPAPLTPLQILFLNLVTDVFPAFAIGLGEGSPSVMSQRPRSSDEPILDRRRWAEIVLFGSIIASTTLGTFIYCLYGFGNSNGESATAAFLTLALAQLWHVFNMHGLNERGLANSVTRNPYVWASLLICVVIITAAFAIPQLAAILRLSTAETDIFLVAILASTLPIILGRFWFMLRRRLVPRQSSHQDSNGDGLGEEVKV